MHKHTNHISKSIPVSASGNTLEEVFENLKNGVWHNIPNFRLEYQPYLEVTVSAIRCWHPEADKYQAECICDISQSIDLQQRNKLDDLELS